jgi:N-acetylmuramoyl-L-alanine amidase
MSLRVAVDPGHGGRDPGAVGFITEAHYTYPWAFVLQTTLLACGVEARMTHRAPGRLRKVSLGRRVRAAERMRADLYISVHVNASENPGASGANTYVHPACSAEALQYAGELLFPLREGIGQHGRGPKRADFYVLRETSMPAVLIEMGFTTNREDADWLQMYWQDQAQRVALKAAQLAFSMEGGG